MIAFERQKVVSRESWLEARKAHLIKEKEFTRLRDELSHSEPRKPQESRL